MISSILDLIVSDLPERTVHMTSGCPYGEANALTEIGDGTEVTLVYGRYSAKAVVRFRSGGECFYDSFELGAPLARQLRLSGDRRYRLVYDSDQKTVKIGPSPVSSASSAVGSDAKLAARRLSVGYVLLSRLGLPDDGRDHTLTVRHGGHAQRLAVRSPANLFENGLRLHPSAARALKLRPGAAYRLRYDQRAKELVLSPAGGRSGDAGQGITEANRSAGTNRSGGANRSPGVNRSRGAAGAPAAPAAAREKAPGAAGKQPAGPPRSRDHTRKPSTAVPHGKNRKPVASDAKPAASIPAKPAPPVFRAAKQGAAGRRGTEGRVPPPKPYMPKGRA
ncbi:hypothetical protein [Cohnella sp. JJ-181]|uniref:hypothetical protein n=1 Tax=Cohnella rhizoplanae TaxID=2974897 RepID=UPI0022FF58FE|nr:hypothetical protein [Cohnella sp. JJ-181]CAI6029258.1 hypothetical protein COHCIP112018_00633 [Cohnella sp. JJ-181]